jgi:hypothetical protein
LWGGSDTNTIDTLQNDTSEEYRQGLLRSLAAGDIAAPNALARFPDDPRVRPALVDATLKASVPNLPNFAQALAIVGGPGALETLLKRFDEVRTDRRVWDDDKFSNRYAYALGHLAKDILRLDPGCAAAATTLVDLTKHRCRANRDSAIGTIVELLKTTLPERTAAILNQGIESVCTDTSPEASVLVLRLLMRRSPEEAVRRLAVILASPDALTRMMGGKRGQAAASDR